MFIWSQIELFDELSIYHKKIIHFQSHFVLFENTLETVYIGV